MRVWPRARARPQPALRPGPCALPPPCAPAATPAAHLGARGITSGSLDLSYFFVRGQPHPAGSFMGNSTHHPPPKQQHRGFEPLGFARPLGPQSLRRRHLPENAGAHPAAGSDGPGGGLGRHTHDARGPDAAARAGPCMPPTPGACMGAWQEHGPRRPSTVQCGTAHTESTLHLHYPSMQYAYICIPTTHLRIARARWPSKQPWHGHSKGEGSHLRIALASWILGPRLS